MPHLGCSPCRSIPRPALILAVGLGFALGCSEDAQSPTGPETVPALADRPAHGLSFRQVSAGRFHTCGVTSGHLAYCWGQNFNGELGDGTTRNDRLTPVAVAGGLRFREVRAGNQHTCGVTTENVAYCWGSNLRGQLGDGTTTDRPIPVAVAGGLRFREVSASVMTCGVTTRSVAYCWGANGAGMLGDGTTIDRLTPVAVAGGLRFRQLSTTAASVHTCGVTTGDLAYCWGFNRNGQLGDGTTTDRSTPVAVAGGLQFRQVSAGGDHTCGVARGNIAYCWGDNQSGQLGDGTTIEYPGSRPTPVAVAGGLRFREVTVGDSHTCGVATGKVAYCWGNDFNFQLGTPTPGDGLTPVAVAGGLRFHQLSAGGDHTCGVATGNVAYCWGTNFSGELGNGTTNPSRSPGAVAGTM
jgi:alpha-tubulin suppressor-like RCC1 family protein